METLYKAISPYLIHQLRSECIQWKNQLEKMLTDNTSQKNLLAEVLQTNAISMPEHLDEAEQFQNEFIRMDVAIKLMSSDISKHDNSFNKPNITEEYKQEILTRQNTLRHEMVAIDCELQFTRYNFYTYLATFS